jgi:hypothetical protein
MFQDWRQFFISTLPQNKPYSWTLTIDPNKRHGGLLTAMDHEANLYCVAEHYEVGKPDAYHADQYAKMLAQYHAQNAAVFADPGGSGAQSILNMAERGIYAAPVPKDAGSVKASIDLISRAAWKDPWHLHPIAMHPETGRRILGAPHIYFCGSLFTSNWEGHTNDSRLIWELQRYRQKPNSPYGTPIKEDDDCVDPLRYVYLARPFAPMEPDMSKAHLQETLDPLSYREALEAPKVLAKATKPRGGRKVDEDYDYALPEVDLT